MYSRNWHTITTKKNNPLFGVQQFANALQISQSKLNRTITKLFNCTPAKLILNYRIDVAIQLLITTEDSIEEIAQKSGFTGHSVFCRSFKKKWTASL